MMAGVPVVGPRRVRLLAYKLGKLVVSAYVPPASVIEKVAEGLAAASARAVVNVAVVVTFRVCAPLSWVVTLTAEDRAESYRTHPSQQPCSYR